MPKRSMRSMFATALSVALMLLGAAPALAHEGRRLGDLEMEVGWGMEPAYAGEVNSVQILLVHDGKRVVDLGDTLDVEVTFGDQTQTFPLEPFFEAGEFGTPGDYRAWLIPTSPGQYSFHFTGTIDGEDVDETFTSGPKTFDDVENPQSVEFPVQQPSTGELAERIDRVEPRLASAIGDVQADLGTTADHEPDQADRLGARDLQAEAGLIGVLAHAGGVPESVSTGLLGLGLVTGWIGLSRLRGRGFPSLPRWGGWALVGIAPLALAASIAVPSILWPPPAAIRPASTATLSFVEPKPNQVVTGTTLDVRLRLDGGRIVQSSSTTLSPDTGHIHVFVDGAIVSMTYGTEQRIPLGGLEPGPHVLQAEFVAADHGPFNPRVTAMEQFVTEGP